MKKKTWGGKREGVGRPRHFDNDPVPINIKVSEETKKLLDKVAKKEKMTLSEVIRKAISEFWGFPKD